MSIYEYNEEDAKKANFEAVKEKGYARGEDRNLIKLVCKKLVKGLPVEEIADMFEEDEVTIQKIADTAEKYAPEYDDLEIYKELCGEVRKE